ncbi:MAG: phosphoenolpyruvate carboxylase [Candidatus Lokiarchaeota archaeon]
MKIPRCMSTQHPDNVNPPFFANSPEMDNEDEVEEAFYAYSHLNCDEQMWDYEGKEGDAFVVKKLLTRYKQFFDKNRLGKDVFLTLRLPNPDFEKAEAKILVETLESIPRSFDASKLIYQDDIAPIFEVILPMTQSNVDLDRIYYYYNKFVIGKQNFQAIEDDISIAEWVGKFAPSTINVIPLVEDKEHMLASHDIIKAYLRDKDIEYQRIFYARSDPALNYGLLSAVLINKIAHQRLQDLSEEISVDFYPIIGVGSPVFRGNFKPYTIEKVVKEYPSVQTFTIQSAFKYDNPPDEVFKAMKELNRISVRKPHLIDEGECLKIIEKYSNAYSQQVMKLAPLVNRISEFIPRRRRRNLHIGLFGYCRDVGEYCLPRAIGFTAAMYSIGIPPSLLGLDCLNQKDFDFILTQYLYFKEDLKEALKYYNPNQNFLPFDIDVKLKEFGIDYEIDETHKEHTSEIINNLKKEQPEDLTEKILLAASQRNFLG